MSGLRQKVEITTVSELIHANHVLNLAKKDIAEGHRLKCFHLESKLYLNLSLTDTSKTRHDAVDISENYRLLGMAAVHDARFMGQPNEAAQPAHVIRVSTQDIFDGRARTHLLDGGDPISIGA